MGQHTETAGQPQKTAPEGAQEISDSTLLDELQRLGDDGTVADAETPAAAAESAGDAPADATGETGGDSETDAAGDDASDDDAAAPAADATGDEPDPELEKRLAEIQRQEKRAKDAVSAARAEFDKERAEFDKRRTEWEPKVKRFEELSARAKYDPAAVLIELGLTEDDFDAASRQLYAMGQEGRKDPALREQSQRSLRDRETRSELAELKRQNAELLKKFEERDAKAAEERLIAQYMGRVEDAVGDAHSLVRSQLANNPEKARAKLRETAEELFSKTGEPADPIDVVAELEKKRRAEIAEYGIDIPAAGSKAAPKTQAPAKASENAVANTLSSDLEPQTKPRTEPITDEELDAQIARELRDMRAASE